MPRVERTHEAEQNLDDIFDYIGRQNHSPAAAAKVLRTIIEKCQIYAGQPLMGDRRPDLGESIRCFPVDSYVVFYEPLADGIRVMAIVHGARDIPALFRRVFGNEST